MTDNSATTPPTGPHRARPTARKLFVNLPVADLDRSITFFRALGFGFDDRFTDGRSAAMAVNDEGFVMLLAEDFFTTFTGRPVPGASGVLIGLSAGSPAEIDELVGRALAAGGERAQDKVVDGPMYGWSFLDPDGHQWELIHMAVAGG